MKDNLLNTQNNFKISKESENEKPQKTKILITFITGFILLITFIVIFFLLRNKITILFDGNKIIKPYTDSKQYHLIKLANKMKVALISDNKTKNSGCGLSVKTGSFYDIIEGLAVFSSNMFLAGSKNFQKENETYIDKIIESEGKSLITTLNNMTTYSFHVHNDNFTEILKIFSEIIDQPKLTTSDQFNSSELDDYMSSLVQIQENFFLSSNHSKFLLKQIVKNFSNESHPYHNLTIGNRKTLNKKNDDIKNPKHYSDFLLSDVKSYFDTFYKTKDMTLIIYSNLTIEKMIDLVKDNFLFESHSSLDVESFLFHSKLDSLKYEPYGEIHLNKIVFYSSTNWNSIYFSFYIKNHPIFDVKLFIEYFKFVFFSRANGTLFNFLFMNGYIHKITIDESDIGYNNFNIFSFRIHIHRGLMKEGYVYIITNIFKYIELISKNGIKKDLYENLIEIKNLKFNTTEDTIEINSITSLLSLNLFSNDYKNFLKGKEFPIFDENVENALKFYFNQLTYNNSIIVIASFERYIDDLIKKMKQNGILEHYNLTYKYENNIQNFLKTTKETEEKNYVIRPINKYIPKITKDDLVEKNNSIYELNDNLNLTLLKNDTDFFSFFASCTKLPIPKIEIILSFYSPYINSFSLENKYFLPSLIMPYLINNILKQKFDEYFETGNKFFIKTNTDSFYLKLLLFKNHTENLRIIKEIMEKIFEKNIENIILRIAKADYRQIFIDYYNQTGIESIAQTHIQYLKAIVSDNYIPGHILLPHLFNYSNNSDFYENLTKSINLNVTMIGKINKTEATEISNSIFQIFNKNHKKTQNVRNLTIKNVTNGQIYYYYFKSLNSQETQHSISVFYQIGLNSFKKYIYTRIFNMCIGNLFINKLKKEKVTNLITDLLIFNNILYYQITAYGGKSNLTVLDQEISLTLKDIDLKNELDHCENFEKKVERVLTESKKIQFTNLYEVSEKVIEAQEQYYSYFHEEDNLVNDTSKITKEEIENYFNKKFKVIPKRITILNFEYYISDFEIDKIIKEINNTEYVLNKDYKGFVTDNYSKYKIKGKPFEIK